MWIVIAFITGVTAAVKRYSKTDTAITIFNYVGYSFPTFWLGHDAHHRVRGAPCTGSP